MGGRGRTSGEGKTIKLKTEQEMGKEGKTLSCFIVFSVVFVPLCLLRIRNTNSQKRRISLFAMRSDFV